jgi:hypothetical protein
MSNARIIIDSSRVNGTGNRKWSIMGFLQLFMVSPNCYAISIYFLWVDRMLCDISFGGEGVTVFLLLRTRRVYGRSFRLLC